MASREEMAPLEGHSTWAVAVSEVTVPTGALLVPLNH